MDKKQPELVAEAFRRVWPEWQKLYCGAVAKYAGVPEACVDIDRAEEVRLRYDGKTPMIDLPKVQSIPGSDRWFDLRSCAALCLDEYSSKFWTRVGPPYQRDAGVPVDDLSEALREFRKLAQSFCEWFYDQVIGVAHDVLADRALEDLGYLEVTTMGLRVMGEVDEDQVDSWLFDEERRPNLRNESLRRFMTVAANLDYDIRELEIREPNAFWMSMPRAIQRENGDLVSRTALYLVRSVKDVVQVTGVGVDDSRTAEFASEVALKMSRFIANRI